MFSIEELDLKGIEVFNELVFYVNGKKIVEKDPNPEWTLLTYLRRKLQLTGTKYGCGEGGCGACTVMISKYNRENEKVVHLSVNACLTPLCSVHGVAITTVEGIGSTRTKLHAVQERIAKFHGSQCGFCTPGIVMSMYTLLRNNSKIKYSDIEISLQGNLCRCTGYRPIIEGFKTFIEAWEGKYANDIKSDGCPMGDECCKKKSTEPTQTLVEKTQFQPYDPSQEPIFPPELKLNDDFDKQFLLYHNESVSWVRPLTIEQLLIIKEKYPKSKIVVGNSEVGVEVKFKNIVYPLLVSPVNIKEMKFFNVSQKGISLGAATTLSELQVILETLVKEKPYHETGVFQALLEMLHWFAGKQIRNVASLVGNIMTASPISDLNPILMASGAAVNVSSKESGDRRVVIDEKFFTGYRKTVIRENEVVLSVEIPFTSKFQFIKAYKQAKRREDDISIVTAAFNVIFEDDTHNVRQANICLGGMGPTTITAIQTSSILKGVTWQDSILNDVFESFEKELNLSDSAPGGMVPYRKSLCLSLFFKYYLLVCEGLKSIHNNGLTIPENYMSATNGFSQSVPKSSQCYEILYEDRKESDSVGKPVTHSSAFQQATGEAIYCDDIPHYDAELFLSLVFSEKSHAKIISIDATEALAMKGVEAFFSAKDLDKSRNMYGPVIKDEEIFSTDVVTSQGCVLGAIVAINEIIARKATKKVKVQYEELPAIITLEEAIEMKSFYPGYPRTIRKGNLNEAFQNSDTIIEGYSRNGSQEHFYLETHSCLAIRKEDELEIICSSQHPSEIAHLAAHALNIQNHKVFAKVKRIGGGFGGKESRPLILALPVCIAAYKLNRPVRGVLDRDEDMQSTGFRHPHLIRYKVGFNNDGKILAAVFDIYNNAGCSVDLSFAVNERSTVHVDNVYNIPNVEVNGYVCKTNLPSNTAFRGFGAPQAMLATESMIRDVANALGKTYDEIAVINMYKEGDLTHFNQTLTHCTIGRCWDDCIQSSNYQQRKQEIEAFNRQNRWKKKGIAMVPTKFGISFQIDLLAQGGALVLIYTDGSILITIGGIEMGQGLFTKMIQVASRALEVDINKIHISETATDKVPNASPTAASLSSDLYGMAVVDACNILSKRLKPYKDNNPDGKWEDWVIKAYLDRVSLSATGFYTSPKITYDFEKNSGNLFEYFTFGVACSEVIIDCLTGDHQVLRTDIVMDLGESINPAIDIGQIEGAFMQGYGFYTMEELIFSPKGDLYSKGPGAYKIPGFGDIPKEFNISLLKGAPNPRAVYSSKAVGEPPLFLASSVFFAIKEAISSARREAGVTPHFHLDAPATCARIRMACEDHITGRLEIPKPGSFTPWNVVP